MADRQETLHFLDYWRVIRSRKEVVIAVALLVILTGILVTYAMPRVYMASVIIQVNEEHPDVPIWTQEYTRYDPLFLRTQFEIIQSAPIIEEVVQKLNLMDTLGRAYGYLQVLGDRAFEQTVKIVAHNMKVQQYRDTNLIELQIFLNELGGQPEQAPELVRSIADEIAIVYRGQSMRRSRENTERSLKALQDAIDEQKKRVTLAENLVGEIREKYKITIVSSAELGTDAALSKQSMIHLEAQRVRVRLELEDKKALYDTIMSLTPEALRDAAPHLVADAGLAQLVADQRRAEVDRSELLKAALGPNHPDVVRVQAIIAELDKKIGDALNGMKTGVKAEYDSARAKLDAIEQELDVTKQAERQSESIGYREYNQAVAEVEHARKIRDALEMRYFQEQIEMRMPRTTVEVIQPAKVPPVDDPVKPNKPLNIVLSIILGLVAGMGLAYFIEYLDTSVKTIEDIETTMGVSVLGVIPMKVRPLIDPKAEPAHAEAYRVLRTNLKFSKTLQGGKALCITSGSVGEGKSLTIFNLGYVCAQFGDRVLIVDSDLHRPRQHKILGVSNSVGLATVLMGKANVEDAITHTPHAGLDFLSSGRVSSGSHGLLATQRMSALVGQLKEMYDYVFFDSPPIIGVSDASLLVREVDGVLLVIQHRKYPRAVSNRAKDMILNVGGNLLGVVLNNINISRDHTYYYYQQHYYYYPRGGRKSKAAEEPAKT